MTPRPRRATTTLVGPNRIMLAASTGALVALASAGTALLVLTGTSSVTPSQTVVPPLPPRQPLAHAPGVVVVPTPAGPIGRAVRRAPVRSPVRLSIEPAPLTPVAPSLVLAFHGPPIRVAPQPPMVVVDVLEVPPRLTGRALAAVRRAPIAETVARGVYPAPVGPAGSTVTAAGWRIAVAALNPHRAAPPRHGKGHTRHAKAGKPAKPSKHRANGHWRHASLRQSVAD